MKSITLSSGHEIPLIGTGTNTFGKVGYDYMGEINGDTTEIVSALNLGYRLVDTAIMYRNESVVGKALREVDLPRESLFITSKIPNDREYVETDDAVRASIQGSLDALGLDYLDLYLIHHPWDNNADMLRVWRVLEKAVESGQIRSIGVSNFNNEQLSYLLEHSSIKPAVNQIESHPCNWQDDWVEFAQKHQVAVEAWGPLKRIEDDALAVLREIGSRYQKSWAQVILNYQISRGVIVIPKSATPERQAQNLDLFDFELTEEERNTIKKL